MEYRRLGKSELNVSVVGIGTWPIGGSFWGKSDDAEAVAAIEKAIDSGVNLIDTAPVYGNGHSERLVARAIKGRRHQVIIATKCGLHFKGATPINDLKPASIRQELEASLRRLGTDVIDLYQCHWPDPSTPIEETIGEMAKMKTEGKIRAIGVSNFDAALTQKAQSVAQIASNQVPYSLLNREIENELVPFCLEKDIGILAYGPIGGGILSGKYKEKPKFRKNDARTFFYNYYEEPLWSKAQALLKELEKIAKRHGRPIAQLAINWVCHQPGISSALVGARNPEQAEANAAAGDWQLSSEDLNTINKALSRIFGEKE
jgi:aryl-alcohol dehydrogenase-like predicted oxidoreductase